ncbi:MAG: nucleotidyltransferase domain-containing protein [Saprospiraceae bacterium]|nr:nucleotidyltransferase domain-containing protein [Saprospiraceae bacterium]
MTREAILDILRTHKPFRVREMGVMSITVFGSYARGSALPGSELDLIVEMETANFQHYTSCRKKAIYLKA